jgi:nucleoside-diphosphate-sugar epimerase
MSDFQSKPLAVTGATGWVGKSALHELQLLLNPGQFRLQVKAYASKPGSLRTTAYGQDQQFDYPVYPLAELPQHAVKEPLGGIFHAAFFPRSGLEVVGVESYISINREITRLVCEAITHSAGVRVVNISSGAAASFDGVISGYGDKMLANPYGALKHEEERRIRELTPSLILRIYSLTGRFMTNPEIYALGDFLLKARDQQQIILKSRNRVVRGFGHAANICASAWAWANSNHPPLESPLATVSDETDLNELARKVSNLFHLPEPVSSLDSALTANIYSTDSAPFLGFLADYGLSASTMDEQIIDTATGLSASHQAGEGSRSHPA